MYVQYFMCICVCMCVLCAGPYLEVGQGGGGGRPP